MKIFISFLQGRPDHPIPAYTFWEYYIKNGIAESGHTWMEADVDWAKGLVPQSKLSFAKWKTETWEKTISFIKKENPDLFISYLYPEQIDINAIKTIKSLGIPTVNFFCDNIREFDKIPYEYFEFDLNWVPEYNACELYKNQNLKFINLPMPMWVDPSLRKISNEKYDQVTFIGSKDIQRVKLFEELVNYELPFKLKIYGSGWNNNESGQNISDDHILRKIFNQIEFIKRWGLENYFRKLMQRNINSEITHQLKGSLGGKLSFEEYIEKTKSSLIIIGINRFPSFRFPFKNPGRYSRLRDIEAPMLGACYLTEWTEGLSELYDLQNEIGVFHTTDQLIEKSKDLLSDKSKRMKMRIAGQKKALNELSIPNSINKLIRYFSLS